MKKLSLTLAVLLALALAGGVAYYWFSAPSGTRPGGSHAGVRPGSQTPDFSLSDISGNVVHSSSFLGKPTVINFFATWCPPCREEMPGFVEVHRKYRERGFELVGISLDTDTREALPGFIASHGIEFRVLFGNISTARAFGGVSSLPTTIFIGRDGRVRNVHVGYIDREAFDREVQKLL